MFSDKLYCILSWTTNICYVVGGSFLLFDKDKKLFSCPNNIKHRKLVQFNFATLGLWAVCCLIIIITLFRSGDTLKFNTTLVYCIGAFAMFPTCALPLFYSHSLCIAVNGCLSYLQYFDGKC